MKVAHLIPPQWEGRLGRGPYRLTYVPWILQDPKPYKYRRKLRSKSVFVILDHGPFENYLGLPGLADIVEAKCCLKPFEVVLPDILGDPKETIKAAMQALDCLSLSTRLMFVPQARTMEDWKRCLDDFLWLIKPLARNVATIGLSSLRRASGLRAQIGTRILMMKYLHDRGFEMHLLGLCSVKHFFEEELPAALQYGVRGVDTCAAFALGARGLRLNKESPRLFLGDIRKYDTLPPGSVDLIKENIQTLNRWVKGDLK